MPEPAFAVDFGENRTVAALVVGEHWGLVTAAGATAGAPATATTAATDWPAASRVDMFAGLLTRIRAEAHRRHGGRVDRVVLATSPERAGRDAALLAAGRSAGFPDVELVLEPVAAVLDPASGPDFPAGEAVLVCDLGTGPGADWRTALVRVAGDHTAVLSWYPLPAGEQLAARLQTLVDSCAELAGELGTDPAGAVLTGAWAAHRGVVDHLAGVLPGRLRPAAEPELAVLRGMVRWLAGAGRRTVPAESSRWRVEPLSWRIPDHDARVVRWLVDEGTPFPGGAVLAQVRTLSDRIYDLTAAADGALLRQPVAAGARTGPILVAAVAPAVSAAAYDPPPHRHHWSTTGGWMLTPRRLVEWDGAGRYVHTRDLVDGAVAGELRPDHGGAKPQRAGVFVDPAGRFCLLTWSLDGEFWVWDIAAAALRARFSVTHHPGLRPADAGLDSAGRMLVNEGRWRLAIEAHDAVSVGRYRRTAVTLWDLDSGQRVDKLVADDWARRHPGYADRSSADRFTTEATSPDRRLRAVAAEDTVTLYETATDRQVFRTSQPPSPRPHRHPHTAFSADGRFLLATWESDDRSTVDVWQL